MTNNFIRWGIIGCGDIVRKRVARAILDEPHSQLVAACRRDESKLREFCHSHGIDRAYTRDTDLINDPNIDVVYIATPVYLHLSQTVAAVRAGKHVLVEKPMALSVAECDRMIEACQTAGVKLGVAYYRRFYPIVARMRKIIAAGEIGQLLSVTASTSTPSINPGDDRYWRAIPAESGGGALMDIGSHRIDLFRHLFGEIAEARAFCSTLSGTYEAEDCVTAGFQFASGMHGSLHCYFGTAVPLDEFSILGTKGQLIANPLNGDKLVIRLGKQQKTEIHPFPRNLHGPLVEDFVAAIREDRTPLVNGEEGRRVNEVMVRIYSSAAH